MRWPGTALTGLVLLFVLSGFLHADPRWWWHDAPVPNPAPGDNILAADIDVVSNYSGNVTEAFFIAWITEPSPIGSGGVWLTASFDGGCSFCDPVLMASHFGFDTDNVSLAVAGNSIAPFYYTIQVAYQENSNIVIVYDNNSIPDDFDPPAVKCRQLQDVAVNRQFYQPNTAGPATKPDITGDALSGVFTHFYVVWQDDRFDSTTEIFFARDRSGIGNWEPEKILTSNVPDQHFFFDPTVSIDFFNLENPPDNSCVNVAYHDNTDIYYLRSIDSGTVFSPTGAAPDAPALPMSEQRTGRLTRRPSVESGYSPFGTSLPLWQGIIWESWPQAQDASDIIFDAQYNDAPTNAAPPWDTDLIPSSLIDVPVGGPALSIQTGGSGRGSPSFLFFEQPGANTSEIFYRGGVLDPAIGRDIDTFPFPPQRSFDPSASQNFQLTYCDFDDATGDCLAARQPVIGGTGRSVASDENSQNVWVVWVDNRSGQDAVWFKRTDRQVSFSQVGLTTECISVSEAKITASFTPVRTCTSQSPAHEKIIRYFVYLGIDEAGPYINTDLTGTDPSVPDTIIIDDNGSLPDPVTVEITGLDPQTTYYVIVVPEDEARNVFPSSFDPEADGATSPQNESSITTPECSGPCAAFSWDPNITAQPSGECEITVTWNQAQGEGVITYTITRTPPFSSPPPALIDPFYVDTDVVLGSGYTYQVTATDSCPPPQGPQTGISPETVQTLPEDTVGPVISNETLLALSACTVSIDAIITANCAPLVELQVHREKSGFPGTDIFPVAALPFEDTVTSNGTYTYRILALDSEGNDTFSSPVVFTATNCEPTDRCLHRTKMASIYPVTPPKQDCFRNPDARGVSLDPGHPDVAYQYVCPFLTGDGDPEPVLSMNDLLIYYQIDDAPVTLLEKDGVNQTVLFSF
ncbi:hypothetical protein ACFLU6_08630 [Acidobacteriota bacterium]